MRLLHLSMHLTVCCWLNLVQGSVVSSKAAFAASKLLGGRGQDPGLPLDKAVVTFSKNEVLIAKEEAEHAHYYIAEAQTHLQEADATTQLKAAKEAYDLARASVPLTKAAATEAKISAVNTAVARKETENSRDQLAAIPQVAADAAAMMIMNQIKAEAISHAEKTAAQVHANFAATKDKRIATAVAGMVQPYHLAVMRAQKASAVYKQKADSAMHSAMALERQAQAFASQAQGYQSAGYPVQATHYMMMAHGMMNDVTKLVGYANKFQGDAVKSGGAVPRWQLEEGTAANFVKGTWMEDPPMPLPAALLQQSSGDSHSPESTTEEVAALISRVTKFQKSTFPPFQVAHKQRGKATRLLRHSGGQ